MLLEEIEEAIEKFRVASWRHGKNAWYGGNTELEYKRKVSVAHHELIELIKSTFKNG